MDEDFKRQVALTAQMDQATALHRDIQAQLTVTTVRVERIRQLLAHRKFLAFFSRASLMAGLALVFLLCLLVLVTGMSSWPAAFSWMIGAVFALAALAWVSSGVSALSATKLLKLDTADWERLNR